MTISSYQVGNVLRAYTKQSSSKSAVFDKQDPTDKYQDTVTLSGASRKDAYDKISYSLMDILLQGKESK